MSQGTDRLLSALRSIGLNPKRSGAGWTCHCPAHDDRSPSLSIGLGEDGRALVHCHAGCDPTKVVANLGLEMWDLMPGDDIPNPIRRRALGSGVSASPVPETPAPTPARRGFGDGDSGDTRETHYATADEAVAELERQHGRRSALWTYHDAAGEPVGMVVRWDSPDGSKQIRPVSRSGPGWGLRGMPTPRPIYALPELVAAPDGSTVYITEGEKAADAVRACGLIATTSPHGSNSAGKADWSPLAERDVVILPDRDEAGEKYAAEVVSLVAKVGARSVRVVRLADRWSALPQGGDAADVLELERGGSEAVRAGIEALTAEAEAETPKPAPIDGAAMIVRVSDVQPERVAWLWPGRIAVGKLTLIAGDPGLGKSFLTLDMAARVSTGEGWPDHRGERITPGGVVLLSAEDGIADTIRPRLDAAGADVSRIVVLDAIRSLGDSGRESTRTFDLSRDLPALESAIRSTNGCQLVVIDPVTAYLGGVDSHKNAEIRGLLAPLGSIAERHGVAVVAVTHLNKSGGGPAIYRAMGSLAFTAAARAAWAVTKDKDDPGRRLLLPIKNNIAPDTGGLAYRIEPQGVDGCPVVAWEPNPVNVSADDALAGDRERGEGRTERDDASDWLRELLADGPRSAKDIESEAKEAGLAFATVRRAKAAIGIQSRKLDFESGWAWVLPDEDAHPRPKVLNPESVSALEGGERLQEISPADDGWGLL